MPYLRVLLRPQVSVNKEKRAAALRAKELLKAVWDEEYSRPDLYEIFSGASFGRSGEPTSHAVGV